MAKTGVLRNHELADKSRRADADQLADHIADLQEAVEMFIKAQPLLEKAARDLGGEFPSGGDGGNQEADEDGPVTGSITERRALDGMSDHAQRASDTLAHIKETVGHIKTVRNEVHRCLPESRSREPVAGGCRSCAKLIDSKGEPFFSPIHRGQWCSWCYDFQRMYKCDPPVVLVELHSRGIKISERRIKEELQPTRRRAV